VPHAGGDDPGRERARHLRHVGADPGGGERIAPVEQELHARPPALDVAPEVLRDDEDGERLAAAQEVARLVVARDPARRAEVARRLHLGHQAPRHGVRAPVEHRPRHVGRLVGEHEPEDDEHHDRLHEDDAQEGPVVAHDARLAVRHGEHVRPEAAAHVRAPIVRRASAMNTTPESASTASSHASASGPAARR